VITGIGATDGDAADRDSLGRADVLVGETGAGVAGSQDIASHPIVRESDRGSCRAVIDFTDAGSRYVQRTDRDIGNSAGGGVSRVVGGIDAADADTADRDGLCGADILVGEAGAGISSREGITGNTIIGEGDGGVGGPVVDPVDPGSCDAQGANGDVG